MPETNGGALLRAINSGNLDAYAGRSSRAALIEDLPRQILTGDGGDFLGNRIVGSDLTAEQVFARMAALGHDGSADPITFHCPQGSCQARAQVMVEHLQQMGLSPSKAWAMAAAMLLQQPLDGYPTDALRPVNEQGTPLINEQGAPTLWSFHVAPALEVQTPTGGRQRMVIDPSLSRGPLSLQEWHRRVGTPEGPHAQQLTLIGQSPIDPFTGIPFAGTGYWPHRGGDPVVGPSQHARQAIQRLLASYSLPPL
jgi:hypothetical protein